MVKHALAFSTFLKLLELEEKPARATLRGFLRKGGFNYWRPMQLLARKIVRKEMSIGEISGEVGILAKGHQRKYNEAALIQMAKWFDRRKAVWRNPPSRTLVDVGASGLSVRIEPEIGFMLGKRHFLMHVWATNTPLLSEETVSAALYFLIKNGSDWDTTSEFEWLIYDTVKDRVANSLSLLEDADVLLDAKLSRLDTMWKEESSPSSQPDDDFPDHPDTPPPP